jgi:hypothetical protein
MIGSRIYAQPVDVANSLNNLIVSFKHLTYSLIDGQGGQGGQGGWSSGG